ncbi:hypothetical protein [Bacillus bingmayongensis]|nr:hypothetical protein [Bacillus bingmayongensis]MBY0596072.1 hypothetical protein [Bacillus bingmayongensis]
MAEYMAQRIIDQAFTYDFIISKRKHFKNQFTYKKGDVGEGDEKQC